MEKKVVEAGVLQSTWNVKTKLKQDGGVTVEVSSLTGDQATALMGDSSRRPYLDIIEAAWGECGCTAAQKLKHREEGSLESEFCMNCNAAAIFFQYSKYVRPVLRAMTAEQLDAYVDTTLQKGLRWGVLSADIRARKVLFRNIIMQHIHPGIDLDSLSPVGKYCDDSKLKSGADLYDERVKHWGKLLVHTYTSGGSRYIISDYCKCSYTHTLLAAHPRAHTLVPVHTPHTHTLVRIASHTHTSSSTHSHTHTSSSTPTCTHTCTNTRTHTHPTSFTRTHL